MFELLPQTIHISFRCPFEVRVCLNFLKSPVLPYSSMLFRAHIIIEIRPYVKESASCALCDISNWFTMIYDVTAKHNNGRKPRLKSTQQLWASVAGARAAGRRRTGSEPGPRQPAAVCLPANTITSTLAAAVPVLRECQSAKHFQPPKYTCRKYALASVC